MTVPSAFSYRYYGADEFILNDQTFMQDSGTDSVMYYAFDTTDEANGAMEKFLADYTENVNPQFDYESKALYLSLIHIFSQKGTLQHAHCSTAPPARPPLFSRLPLHFLQSVI